ncbi:uncharacterized protein JCM6883_001253 [Sporobolomyces salmoneus]|uniref:uncharacterized protein n=1 Tax=Sporobolomyces salmoneus TaxID=183962 RepID=UPI00316EE707
MDSSILPSGGIHWTPCPDSHETYCSFHRVPLDYTNPKLNETVSLALRMLPSTVAPSEHLGYLFINPGGPGGSGTEAVVRFGFELQVILEGRYNVISWDPRGVNLTNPDLGCFETEGDANRFGRDILSLGLPLDARGPKSLNYTSAQSKASELTWTTKFDAYSQALQESCDSNANVGIMRGSSTAFAARDMWSIAQSLGEEKVNYWGFSYGTILGATFAAVFPEKVNRFILDGVSDSVSYTQDFWQWGIDGMTDTHKTLAGFFSSCAESGPQGCEFTRRNSTSQELRDRLDAIYEKLKERPLAVGKSELGPGVVTASDVHYTIFHSLYAPKTWPRLASLLSDVERGNGTRMFEEANKWTSNLCRSDPSKNPFHTPMIGSMASAVAIMCGDTEPSKIRNDTTVETLQRYMEDLRQMTESPIADEWAVWISQCRRWTPEPFETYRGPWTVKDGLNKTAFPILFMSMTADPVTPLPAARRMAANFGPESATLLIQNGFGHCSVAHPSLCTAKKARSYFLDGSVPKMNTTCDADPGFLFPHPSSASSSSFEVLSTEDRKLREALHGLADKMGERRGRGLGPL